MLVRLNAFLGAGRAAPKVLFLLPIIHLNLILFSCSFWMQQPLISQKIKQLNGTEMEFGTLQSTTAVFALMGSTVMGRIIDLYGNKCGLILAHVASTLTFLLLGFATTISMVFASVVPAFFQHGMLASQAAVANVCLEPEMRSSAFGRLSLSYGIGMSIGSPLGSLLASKFGLEFAFHAAAAMSIVAVAIDIAMPSFTVNDEATATPLPATATQNQLQAILQVATGSRQVMYLLTMSFVGSIGPHMFRAMLPLVFESEGYGEAKDLGLYMSYVAVLSLISNVFVVGPVVRRFGESYSLLGSLLVGSCTFFASFVFPKWVYVLQAPQSIAFGVFYTVSSGLMSNTVSAEQQGTVSALGHATRSINQVIGPVLGGIAMRYFQFAGLRLIAGASLLCSALIAIQYIRDQHEQHQAVSEEKKIK